MQYLSYPFFADEIGANVNYSFVNPNVSLGFDRTGDAAYPFFKRDLEWVLDRGVRVALVHGDADYIANWFGGEAVSLALNHSHAEHFRAAGYAPFVVDGEEYGVVREFGNLSFTRVYEAGHLVPYHQPKASLELFRRVVNGLDIARGKTVVSEHFGTNGTAEATHTEAYPGPPGETGK